MPLGRAQADPCKNLSWLPLPSSWGWWLDFSARARDSQNHSFLTLSVSITHFLPSRHMQDFALANEGRCAARTNQCFFKHHLEKGRGH